MSSSGHQPGYGPPSYPQHGYRQPAGYGPGAPQPQPYPQPQAGPPRPHPASRAIPVATTGEIPGRRISSVVGDAIGVVTRHHAQPSAPGRPVPTDPGLAAALTSSRQEAVRRMTAMALDAGANAVVGMRFDSQEAGPGLTEVAAYGTAVVLDTEVADAAPAAESGSQPGTSWWPSQGSTPLLGDPEAASRHATGSPVLPGSPQPDA